MKVGFWIGALLLSCGCGTSPPERSALFYDVIADTAGLLRGQNLEIPFSQVARFEDSAAMFEDAYGSVFRYRLMAGQMLDVEYWRHPEKPLELASVILNLHIGDEWQARERYAEFAEYYSERLNSEPEGVFGNFRWKASETRLLELRFENGRRDITLALSKLTPP